MTRFVKAAGFLLAWAVILFALAAAVYGMAGNGDLLARKMLFYAPPENTGLPEAEYPGVARMTAAYLTGREETFQYVFSDAEGNRFLCFQDHEAAHMADCRGLIRLDTALCAGCGIAALLLTAAGMIRRKGRREFLRGVLRGMIGTAGLAVILIIWALADFNGLFVTFHKVAFRNDGWLLNPQTDLLIRLMPSAFFVRLGIRGLLRFAAVPAVMAAAVRIGLKKKHDEV